MERLGPFDLPLLGATPPALLLTLSALVALAIAVLLVRLWRTIRDAQPQLAAAGDDLGQHGSRDLPALLARREAIAAELPQVRQRWRELQAALARQQQCDATGDELQSYAQRATRRLALVGYGVQTLRLVGLLRESALLVMRLADATRIPSRSDPMAVLLRLGQIEKDILLHLGDLDARLGSGRLAPPTELLLRLPRVIERHTQDIARYEESLRASCDAFSLRAAQPAIVVPLKARVRS